MSMKETCITILRDQATSIAEYRKASDLLSMVLAIESGDRIHKKTISLQTPLSKAQGVIFSQDVVLLPILRSGLVMLPSFLRCYPNATVGLFGVYREETTALPTMYYSKLPVLRKDQSILILDPMLATAGTACMVVKDLMEKGIEESQMTVISFLAAPEGLKHFESMHPNMHKIVAQIDAGLDKNKRILPGIGDFGDRYFGTVKT